MIAGLLAALLPSLPTIILRVIGAYSEKQQAAANEIIQSRQAKRDVMVAEASPINAIMRFLIALGPALYLFKIFAIDKVWCSLTGCQLTTDPLTPDLWEVVKAVVGFYFLYELGIGATKIVARKK